MIALAPMAAVVAALVNPAPPVTCAPIRSQYGENGMAYFTPEQTVGRIVLDTAVCADYRSGDPYREGSALLVVLHEAEHAALESFDEAQVECHALRLVWAFTVPVYAREFGGDAFARAAAIRVAGVAHGAAVDDDAALPGYYHLPPGQPCG